MEVDWTACYTLVDYEHMQNDTIRWERVASALGEIFDGTNFVNGWCPNPNDLN